MKCSIGKVLNKPCSSSGHFRKASSFSERERKIISLRSGVRAWSSICVLHDRAYRVLFQARQKVCCNPLNLHTRKRSSNLWTISENMHDLCQKSNDLSAVIVGKKLCIQCKSEIRLRLRLHEHSLQPHNTDIPGPSKDRTKTPPLYHSASGEESDSETTNTSPGISLEKVNTCIKFLGQSPLRSKKMKKSRNYSVTKLQSAISALTDTFQEAAGSDVIMDTAGIDLNAAASAGNEMLQQLKDKFLLLTNNSEKIQLLSVLPKSWSIRKIQEEFGASEYLIRKMKKCLSEQGILCTPNLKYAGRTISQETIDLVVAFYREPDISRETAGRKQYKSVKEGDMRVHKQKRLVLGNLKEIYKAFKDKYPDKKIGFSKFASLRPLECVLAGSSGTHSVCVCTVHQNFKLQFFGAKLDHIEKDGKVLFPTYRECLYFGLCESKNEECFMGVCKQKECGNFSTLSEIIESFLADNYVDEITYKRWTQVDRCSLQTVTEDINSFCDSFVNSIPKVLKHDHIAHKQSEYYKMLRDNLKTGEVLAVADFSENYSFVVQDAVQGVHWSYSQATIHPFACYIVKDEKVVPLNFVVISDCLNHTTATVHTFQRSLVGFLRKKIPELAKIFYFSDGAASQYKNRFNMINLVNHENDFKVKAEWHFFATSHGKGPTDGLGGTIKRLAARTSLQRPLDNQILSPVELFDWARQTISGMDFVFVPKSDVEQNKKFLNARF